MNFYKISIIILLFLCSMSIFSFTQIDTNGNVLWLRSDTNVVSSNDTVSEWRDNSSYNNHAFQTTQIFKPKKSNNISLLNNMPVIKVDGINDFLEITDNATIDFNTEFSFFFVIKQNVATSYQGIITKWNYDTQSSWCIEAWQASKKLTTYITDAVSGSGVNTLTGFNIPFNKYNIFTIIYNGNLPAQERLRYYLNHDSIPGFISGTIQPSLINCSANIKIGVFSGLSRYFNGEYAEIIMYNIALNDTQRINTENYLHNKFAPQVDLGPNININYGFCDTIINAGSWFNYFSWSTGDTIQSIDISNSDQYSVTVTDIFGRISSDSIYINYNYPNQFNDTTICLGDTIYWNTNLSHDYNFLWSDGSNDSIIPIYEAGEYYVQVSDTIGPCSFYTDTITVTIDSFPQNATLGPDVSLCAGNSLSINLPAESFEWSTGDTSSFIVLDTTGQYWVQATNNLGCHMSDTINVFIQGYAPSPDFSNSITCIGDITFFTDSSFVNDNSNIISWQWDFGDANTSSTQHPSNLYLSDGIYPVQLIIETDSGCFNSITHNVQVYSLPNPDLSSPNLCSNTNLQFTDISNSNDGNIINWQWNFGNGDTSSIQNPIYSYNNSGIYTINLDIETEYGCKNSFSQEVEVIESPIAKFEYLNNCFGNEVYFIDNSISNPVHPILNWYWDFGNGNTSNSANPSNIFNSAGMYQVEFVIKSLNSCTDTLIKTISINATPVADFKDSVICVENSYQFNDSSQILSGSIITWKWNFDNTINFIEQNPVYTFSETGDYEMELIVVSDSGCVDTLTKIISIVDLPDASFTINPSYGIPYSLLHFTNDNNYNFLWDFGNGYTFAGQNPTYAYPDSGTFDITLYATDQNGCLDSSTTKFSILLPNCDIAVLGVNKTFNDQFLSVSATFANFSNIPLESFDVLVDIGKGYSVKETVDTFLVPGNIMTYNFKGRFEIDPDYLPELICVKAELSNCTDNIPDNNEYCLIDENAFNVFNLYPNPFSDEIYIELNIPAKGEIIVQVFDDAGKRVDNYKFEDNAKGFNRLKINTANYSQGTYTIKLKYTDQSISKMLLKE